MGISPGSRFGSYEVTAPLGEGGMGVVFRGRDSRLQRDVALKLLPDNFASDPDRLARFQREAQVLASLNHPNIAQVYGLENAEGSACIVMELVEGETIADRLKKGPLSFQEAIEVATQIADALAAAHERGVVHRDLKPANIKLTPNGTVKVLDFGLAKAVGSKASNPSLTSMPTVADGSAIVDARTDIWAFGCVLYEMLTAHRAFEGETATDIIAKIVTSPPDLNLLPKDTPSSIRMLLSSVLNKNSNQRLQHIGDARLFLDGTLTAATPANTESVPASRSKSAKLVMMVLAALLAVVSAPAVLYFLKSAKPSPQMRFDLSIEGILSSPSVSPDGQTIAYIAQRADARRTLWIRSIGTDAGQQLPGTEEAGGLLWSPDSKKLIFIAEGKLKKIDLAGGSPNLIAEVGPLRGADWNRSGVILLARASSNVIERISDSGGPITPVTKLDASRQEALQALPVFLPDGNHFLYVSVGGKPEDSGIFLSALDANAKPSRVIALQPTRFNEMSYVMPGILIYSNEGKIIAQRLDKSGSKVQGSPAVIGEDIEGNFSASNTGLLIYHKAAPVAGRQLRWFGHDGKQGSDVGPTRNYGNVDLSPTGDRAAVDMVFENNRDIWMIDLARSVPSRITFNLGQEWSPVWSPDGQRLAFVSNRAEFKNVNVIMEKSATGAGMETKVDSGDVASIPVHWSPDDKYIVFSRQRSGGNGFDNWLLPLFGDRKPRPYLESTFDRIQSRVSPDSRYLAYTTNETGTFQIVVQTFPDPNGGKWQISADGGVQPKWRRDGRELYYLSLDGKMMSVPVSTGPAFTAGRPMVLFQTPLTVNGKSPTRDRQYDVAPDGRFLMNVPAASTAYIPFTVVLNWDSLLAK
jgi:serine/threonine protein kinase/Tol biopolymer transport system component